MLRRGSSSTSAACHHIYLDQLPIRLSRRTKPSGGWPLSRVRWCCRAAPSPACWRFALAVRSTGAMRDLFTLAVPAVAAEVAAAGVFKLAVTLGADADHV